MKLRTSLVASVIAALGAVACASNPPLADAPSTTGATTSAFTTDAEIAAYTEAANKAELKQAQLALARAKSPEVKAFAQFMIEQHGQAERSQEGLMSSLDITPVATAPTSALENGAESAMSSLGTKSGDDFDEAYIDLQVDEHRQVLRTLDNDLIPAAHDADFKRQLSYLHPTLEEHLRRAEAIQRKLAGM